MKKNTKKLFLHIGAGKTGTSAIQSQLAINTEKLKNYNYNYPVSSTYKQAQKFKITSGNAIELGYLLRDEGVLALKKIKSLVSMYIKDAKGKDIILSSEVLQQYKADNAKRLKEVFNSAGYEVIIVYYVRAIADYLVSSYHQSIKRHNNTNNFQVSVKNTNNKFLATIKRSKDIFGNDNLIIKNYDAVKKNIFIDFLENVLDIKDSKDFEIINKKVNRSLTSFEISFMKQINKFFVENHESAFISNALIDNSPNKKYQMSIDEKNLNIIKSKFNEDIKEISSYLDESEKPYDIVNDLRVVNKQEQNTFNPFHEAVIAVLAELTKEIKKK